MDKNVNKSILGLNYLIKYMLKPIPEYKNIIKDCAEPPKFWLLFILMTNNIDSLYEEIDINLLSKVFKEEPIELNKNWSSYYNSKYFPYGNGIKVKSPKNYSYIEQFKIIRNSLAHNRFAFLDDDMIFVEDLKKNYKAIFDIKWLETLIFTTVYNNESSFYKGLTSHLVLLPYNENEYQKTGLKGICDRSEICFLKIEILSQDVNDAQNHCKEGISLPNDLNIRDIKDSLRQHFQEEINKAIQDEKVSSCSTIKKIVEMDVNNINGNFKGIFRVEIIPINYNDILKIAPSSFFENLSIDIITKIIADYYNAGSNNFSANSTSIRYLFETLNAIKTGEEINPRATLLSQQKLELVIKAYCLIMFYLIHLDQSKEINNYIKTRYGEYIKYDHGHTKNNIKNELKTISNSIKDLNSYGESYINFEDKINELSKKVLELEKKLLSMQDNNYDVDLLSKIRNAMIHDNMAIKDGMIYLTNYEPDKYYPRYNKNKKEWETKIDDKNSLSFNFQMPIDKFLEMVNEIFSYLGYQTSVNISKYVKRADYLK